MKLAVLAALGLGLVGATGCTAYGAYPSGVIYNGTVVPHHIMRLQGAGAPKPGTKTGEACATGILGLVAFGDASLASAKKAGGISDVDAVEFGGLNVLGIYSQGCTIVAGQGEGAPPPPPAPPAAPPPPPPAAPPPPPPPMKGAQLDIPGEIEFDVGVATIKDTPASRAVLEAALNILSSTPSITRVRIEGHTDSDGGMKYNLALSEKRAASVIAWLVGKGIDANRLHNVGCASKDPLVPNTSAANKHKNRRTEFDVEEIDGKKPDGFTEACAPNPAVHH